MKNLSIINAKDYLFIINKENGLWAITNKKNPSFKEIEKELDKPLGEKKYTNIGLFAINTTTQCNMGCLYCSVGKDKKIVRKIDYNVGKAVVDKALESNDYPTIVFHGSESMMNFEAVKKIVKYGKKKEKELNKRVDFSIQSNLTILTNEMIEFIKENKIGISTSLDGIGEIHNITRHYRNGKPSYQDVIKNMKKIRKIQGNISVVTVVTKYNVDYVPEIALAFEKQGIESVQFTFMVPKGDGDVNNKILPKPNQLTNSLLRLFDQTIQRLKQKKQKIQIRNLSRYVSSFFFRSPMDTCIQCSNSSEHPLIAIDTNGDIYPCDFFWDDKDLKTGNIVEDSLESLINNPNDFRISRDINNTSCSPCTWKRLCGGGCAADIYVANKKSFNGKPYYCSTYKKVFEYMAKNMMDIAKSELLEDILEWVTFKKQN